MGMISLVVALVVLVVLNLLFSVWDIVSYRKRFAAQRRAMATILELFGHLRRTMEDLQSRDPQIAETLEFEIGQLATLETTMRKQMEIPTWRLLAFPWKYPKSGLGDG